MRFKSQEQLLLLLLAAFIREREERANKKQTQQTQQSESIRSRPTIYKASILDLVQLQLPTQQYFSDPQTMNSSSVSLRSTRKFLLSVSLMLILNAVIGIQAQQIENTNLYPYNPPQHNGANPAESGMVIEDELFVFIPPELSNGDNPDQTAASLSGTNDELYPYIPPPGTSSTKSPSTGFDSVGGDLSSFTLDSANSGVWRSQCQGIILSLIVGAIFV